MNRRLVVVVLVYLGLLAGGWFAGRWVDSMAFLEILPQNESHVHRMIMIATIVFILTSALPFVPGAEVGFVLLMVFGAEIALLVYVAMVAALILGFLLGRLIPVRAVARFFATLGLKRAQELVTRMADLGPSESLAFLVSSAPTKMIPLLLKHRYLAIMVLFNLPGNSALGGGGGIAFVAGISRLFSLPQFILSVLVAVAPIPLYVVWTGTLG